MILLQIDEERYLEQFKPTMMDVVFEWCNGASFMELCKKTDIFEGKVNQLYGKFKIARGS